MINFLLRPIENDRIWIMGRENDGNETFYPGDPLGWHEKIGSGNVPIWIKLCFPFYINGAERARAMWQRVWQATQGDETLVRAIWNDIHTHGQQSEYWQLATGMPSPSIFTNFPEPPPLTTVEKIKGISAFFAGAFRSEK